MVSSFPARGQSFETWDPARKRIPNRGWRRWGSDRLVEIVLRVVREYRHAHPWARPLLIGDLSRTHGGDFGPQFGALGHASHQNGLDVDVYYPRRDGYLRPPTRPRQIDHALAQDLLDRFLRAGATTIFVGPHTRLRGPRKIVVPLIHHDNHMHVRIARENRRSLHRPFGAGPADSRTRAGLRLRLPRVAPCARRRLHPRGRMRRHGRRPPARAAAPLRISTSGSCRP